MYHTMGKGFIALLDLPPGTSVTIDGSSHAVGRDDFVGVSSVPRRGFHLVVVSSAGEENAEQGGLSKPSALHTTGFVVMRTAQEEESWIVARRYDPQTEEVSSEPVDDLTAANLLRAVGGASLGPQRVVPYERFLTGTVEEWLEATRFVTEDVLRRCGLADGDKIAPGSYEPEEGEVGTTNSKITDAAVPTTTDGMSVSYPPIPCIDSPSAAPSGKIARKRHAGTRRYLSRLSPSDRTALFLDPNPGGRVLRDVLSTYYGGYWEALVGDVQLSFLLFLHLGCLSSFEHWRDTISMFSFASPELVSSHTELYSHVIRTTTRHLSSIEKDFFEEVEYSGGNFFVPALHRIARICSGSNDDEVTKSLCDLSEVARARFGLKLSVGISHSLQRPPPSRLRTDSSDDEEVLDIDMNDGSAIDVSSCAKGDDKDNGDGGYKATSEMLAELEDSDEDGPIIIAEEEVEASFARTSVNYPTKAKQPTAEEKQYRQSYPLLFAAMSPQEDVVMTCARVLDEATDVSLVREAAAYLEEIESARNGKSLA